MSAKAEIKTVKTENCEMRYCTFGNGKKFFVILPGLSMKSVLKSANAVSSSYKAFAKNFTAYLFDYGDNVRKSNTPEKLADDVAASMEALGLCDVYMLGVSLGGMIAQCIAIKYPHLIKKLVLGSTLSRLNDTMRNTVKTWVELSEKKDGYALAEHSVSIMCSDNFRKNFGDFIIQMNKDMTDEDFEKFRNLAKGIYEFDVYGNLGQIKCPTLVIGAKNDKVLTGQASVEIAEKLGCELYMYDENYGHIVYDEASDYKERILNFFEK